MVSQRPCQADSETTLIQTRNDEAPGRRLPPAGKIQSAFHFSLAFLDGFGGPGSRETRPRESA